MLGGPNTLTILDAQDQIPEPAPAGLFAVRIRLLFQAHLHDHALFAHFQDYVERVLLGIVEHLNELYQVRVVQLLHDGNLLSNEIERIAGLASTLAAELGRKRVPDACPGKEAMWLCPRTLAQDMGLGTLPQARLGELFDGLVRLAVLVSGVRVFSQIRGRTGQ